MKAPCLILLVVSLCTSSAFTQTPLYDQPLFNTGGTLRPSQLWQDPNGNDSDLDAIAWEDFTLPADATITRVQWIGEAAPVHGFRIGFWNQDPNTTSIQPDIFTGPFDEHDYPSVTQTAIGNGLYSLEVQIALPQSLLAATRYFVSIIGLTPQPYLQWKWAQGIGPGTGTFYWQRADGGRYTRLGDERAVTLLGLSHVPTLSVSPDPLVAGQNGTFTVDFMTPATRTYLIYSLRGVGSTYVGQLNVTLDLAQPQQAGTFKTTNSNGHAVWALPIPPGGRGHNIWFQAAQYGMTTNVVATRMQ